MTYNVYRQVNNGWNYATRMESDSAILACGAISGSTIAALPVVLDDGRLPIGSRILASVATGKGAILER